jgi:hypothetical protein
MINNLVQGDSKRNTLRVVDLDTLREADLRVDMRNQADSRMMCMLPGPEVIDWMRIGSSKVGYRSEMHCHSATVQPAAHPELIRHDWYGRPPLAVVAQEFWTDRPKIRK